MNSTPNAPAPAKLMLNLGLKDRNTFGLDAVADIAFEITAPEQIAGVMKEINEQNLPWRVLGGGSNVILPNTISSLVVRVARFLKDKKTGLFDMQTVLGL